jgi:hypothetical protein
MGCVLPVYLPEWQQRQAIRALTGERHYILL